MYPLIETAKLTASTRSSPSPTSCLETALPLCLETELPFQPGVLLGRGRAGTVRAGALGRG